MSIVSALIGSLIKPFSVQLEVVVSSIPLLYIWPKVYHWEKSYTPPLPSLLHALLCVALLHFLSAGKFPEHSFCLGKSFSWYISAPVLLFLPLAPHLSLHLLLLLLLSFFIPLSQLHCFLSIILSALLHPRHSVYSGT